MLELDSGVLAAAVGPVRLKVSTGGGGGGGKARGKAKERKGEREVLVMLGLRTPEDEVVMLPPT